MSFNSSTLEKNNNNPNPENIDNIHATFARHLYENRTVTEVGAYLKQTTITNAERVTYITNYLNEFNLIPKIRKSEKSNKISINYREKGNEAFRLKKLNAAVELYSKSIAFAENIGSTECLAFGYANRSAVLFELNYFRECNQDIDRAFSYDYPTEKKTKLLSRQKKAENLIAKTKIYKFYNDLTEEITNPNDIIKCASNKLKIEYNSKIGRHVVATENIRPGEVIAIEKPYIAILLRNYFYTHCHFCLNHCLNPIPCDQCPYAMFCNENCKQNAINTHHKYECKLLANIMYSNLTKMAQLSLRIAIMAKDQYEFIADKLMQKSDDLSHLGLSPDDTGKLVLTSNYTGIHYLITNTEHYPINELFHKSIIASILLDLLKQIDFFESMENQEKMFNIASELLLRHLQTAPSNFHQISAIKPVTDNYSELEAFADGAYPFLSMLNHSCAPNVFRAASGVKMILRALRPIKKGQQLFDSYGLHHALAKKSERIAALKDQYYFVCECEACTNDWPTWRELESSNQQHLPELHFLEKLIPQVSRRNITEARDYIPKMIEMLAKMESKAPCDQLCQLQETFKEIYFLSGNVFDILKPGY